MLLELDRRDWLISEIGGELPSNDTLVNVLWMTMDPGTRCHISGQIDAASNVEFQRTERNDHETHHAGWSHQWWRCGEIVDSYGRKLYFVSNGRRPKLTFRRSSTRRVDNERNGLAQR